MPANSRRGKILENLIRQLQTITTANGYVNNVHTVTTAVTDWRNKPKAETPIIFVVDESTRYDYSPGRLTERTWTLGLYVIMRNSTQSQLEEFITDIELSLNANQRLAFDDTGAVCAHHRIRNIVTDNQLFSLIDGTQMANITIELIYTQCVGTR